MPEAVGSGGAPSAYSTVSRFAAAAVTVVGAFLLAGWAFGIAALQAGTGLVIALVFIVALSAIMWWAVRALGRAEEQMLHRERLYAMLSHCNQAIVHATDTDALLAEICRIACLDARFGLAWIAWLQESSGEIKSLAHQGDRTCLDALVRALGPRGTEGDDPVAQAIAGGEHVVVNDVKRHASTSHWRLAAVRHGFGSLAVFPIRFEGRALGALAVYAREAEEFGREEVRLLDEVARDLSFALDTFDRETRRREAEESLRETSHMLQTLVDASPLAIVVIDEQSRVLLWSPAAERMFGWNAGEVVGEVVPFVPREEIAKAEALRPDRQFGVERRRQRKDGTLIDISLWSSPLRDADGEIIGTLGILADITERRQLEKQIRQSQKLDALGSIAGGIAHDFNNVLTVLRGNLSLAQATLEPDHAAQVNLAEMDKACSRAADLVRQILTFGRQQEQSRKVMSLQPAVQEASKLLRATAPARITINTRLPGQLPTVMADSAQIQQAILNLGINAAHAMEQSGRIDIALEALTVDAGLAATCPQLHQGRYVRLTVADTGVGIAPEMLDRIFEPFYTTKAAGRGTGLGLAVVRGIVRNHDGAITVSSERGQGSRFDLYFPVVDGEVAGRHEQVEALHGNGERVLFLDDEEPLVALASRMLKRLGYEVEAHTRAADALADFRRRPADFDLVLTDLSMPGASGMDFARSVLDIRKDVPVVLTTGYIDPDDLDLVQRIGVREVILKPTTIEEMGRVFRRLLAERPH